MHLSIGSAQTFATSLRPGASSIEQLDLWLAESSGLDCIDVPADRWQRIRNESHA
jgi:hypothetical protein